MSHEIESISYVGATPWHGIGFMLQDAPTPGEMLKHANLNWTVSKRPLYTTDTPEFVNKPFGHLIFKDLFALVRDSDNKIFGVCGPRYQPFQNSETFEFFNKFTEAGNMKMEVAGSLKGGTWVWALAKLEGEAFNLMENDPNYSYLLLCSPHVWGEALTIMFTSVRVVCWNTLTQAMGKSLAEKFRFIHNTGFQDVRALAELTVEQAMIQKAVYEQKAKLLAESPVVDITSLYSYIATVMKQPSANPAEFSKPTNQVLTNYHVGPGATLRSSKDTWWGAYNAVTYFFDHQYGRLGADERLFNAWLSHANAVTKRNAFELAVQYAEAA